MSTLVNQPVGTSGNVVVSESTGSLTIEAKEGFSSLGISADLAITVSSVALVNAWAAATTNATLKEILAEAALLLAALPA